MSKSKQCEENAKSLTHSPVVERVRLSEKEVLIQFCDVGGRANIVAFKLFGAGAGARNDGVMNTCMVALEQFAVILPSTFLRRFHDRLLADYKTYRPQHFDALQQLLKNSV